MKKISLSKLESFLKEQCDALRGAGLDAAEYKDYIIAMTLGCESSDSCFDVIFEKALRSFTGSYAVINNEFAKTLTDYKYINREEDLGIEGLRKSKLSYYPAILYDRFDATLK